VLPALLTGVHATPVSLASAAGSTEATTEPTPEPTESLLPTAQDAAASVAAVPCAPGNGTFCGVLVDWGVPTAAAQWVVSISDTAARIVVILVLGMIVRYLLHKAIRRLAEGIATGTTAVGRGRSGRGELDPADGQRRRRPATLAEANPLAGERRAQRSRTIGSVLSSVTTGVVAGLVVLLVLGEFNVNLAPLLAGAGVAGVALGFGAQTLVKDFLSGIFMIVEDQYGVGDVVDLGEAVGSVEAVGLRVTRLRGVDGTVWYVRNGEVLRVGNQSQGWARAVLDVGVAYGEDVGTVQDLLRRVGHELYDDPDWRPLVMEEPEVWGVESLSADAVVVRLVVKTVPLEQWKVAREVRRRIKATFDAEGIEIPFPQRSVWVRDEATKRRPSGADQDRHDPPPPGESKVAEDCDVEDRVR
jgi:moderate conductance mechanosensitive channel